MRLRSGAAGLLSIGCALAAGALLLAACGSKSDDKRLTRTAYISQADALCRESNKLRPTQPAADARTAAANANREANVRKSLVDKLATLQPPKALDGPVTIYLGQSDALITQYRKHAKDIGNYERSQRDRFGIDELLVRREKTAYEVGYKACGRPPTVDGSKFDPNLIRQADAACRPPDEAILNTLGPRPLYIEDLPAIARLYDMSLPVAQASLPKLRALRPAPAAQAEYARFLKSYGARVAITVRQSRAAHVDDRRAHTALSREDAQESAREASSASILGFEVCGVHGTAGV